MATAKSGSDTIPALSLLFGYGPMLPFVAALAGAWLLPSPWPALAVRLALLWGALILAFVAGVRRGFGFAAPQASTAAEIGTMLAYFVPAGLSLVLTTFSGLAYALALQAAAYLLVAILDTRAARAGNVPRHFAHLRGPQMAIAAIALAALLARQMLVTIH